MSTVKILRKAAFKLGASNSPIAWSATPASPGSGDGFPYLSLGNKQNTTHEDDASIATYGFTDTARLVGVNIEDSMSVYLRRAGLESFLYWCFGMENAPVPVCVLTTDSVGTFVLGDTYEDSDESAYTLIRSELLKNGTHQYVFRCDDEVLPNLTAAVLNRASGTGIEVISIISCSALLYEHLFTLDAKDRSQDDYRSVGVGRYTPDEGETYELAPLNTYATANTLGAGDKKCRRATIGLALGTGDFIYAGAMCKKFEISSEAGKLATMSADYVARNKLASASASSTWTVDSHKVTNDNVLGHHDFKVVVATSDSSASASLGVVGFNVGVEIPIKIEQDTESGLYLEEPVFEGAYGISTTVELSRHSASTFEGYRDGWTNVCARMEAHVGFEKFGLYIESAKISEAGPSDDMVAKESLNLVVGFSDTDVFTESLYSYLNRQGSPVLCLVRNSVSEQMMNLN